MADRATPNVQLPESALHTILSSLPPADAIRASATSRQWRSAWISSPFLSFDEKPCPFKNADFFDYVDRSIALCRHRCDRRLNLEKLSLSASIDHADSASRLHPIISFAESRRVEAIELLNDADEFWLILHTDPLWPLLFACDSLDALSLRCFAFYLPSPLAISASAKKLVFKCNLIDDVSLRCFLSCFPSLEHLALGHCLGLHEIRISSSSLQTLELFLGEDAAERIVIDAASLRSLSYERSLRAPGIVRLFNCRSLTSLTIGGIRFDPESGTNPVQDYVSQIPVLEDLTLDGCRFSGVIRISHWNLRRLSLERSFGLKKAEIWTPNLRFFKYFGGVFDFSAFRYGYGFLEAKLGLCTCSFGDTEWFWFVKLRNFLESFNKCYSLKLDCFVAGFPEELRDIGFLPDSFYELTHLTISNWSLKIEDCVHFVGAIVELFPCVETLTLKTSFAIISIKFDESGSFSTEWRPTVGVANKDNYAIVLQSIKDAVDKIVELLSWTDEDNS